MLRLFPWTFPIRVQILISSPLFQRLSMKQTPNISQSIYLLRSTEMHKTTFPSINVRLILILLWCFFSLLGGGKKELSTAWQLKLKFWESSLISLLCLPPASSFCSSIECMCFPCKPSCLPFPSEYKPLGLRLKQWCRNQSAPSILPSVDPLSPLHQRISTPFHSPASNPKTASDHHTRQIPRLIICLPLYISVSPLLMNTLPLCLSRNELYSSFEVILTFLPACHHPLIGTLHRHLRESALL